MFEHLLVELTVMGTLLLLLSNRQIIAVTKLIITVAITYALLSGSYSQHTGSITKYKRSDTVTYGLLYH